jgi:tRNA-splicing ligase RtcB (3'-phosphate/5'-hydroxy nucleic acid ligase)
MNVGRKEDPLQAWCFELAKADGVDPVSRVPMEPGSAKLMPAWCLYRGRARDAQNAAEAANLAASIVPQSPEYANAPLTVLGWHEPSTIDQMRNCMKVGNVVGGALMADGHLGYAQPVGGVVAYEDQVSISGVGFDIACGNMAVRLDTPARFVKDDVGSIIKDIARNISFGVGRTNDTPVAHELFDDGEVWRRADREDYRVKAAAQLGTVGSGNHYVDLFEDESGLTWIGVHFGSRGLGHTSATKYLKLAGGVDGIHVPPTVVDVYSELGMRYLSAMHLAGRYAYAGREWVVERVRQMIGGSVIDSVHNHHNYAWRENHLGRPVWVVRKGATPAFPDQRGFVGGSMGDNAVIIRGARRGSPDNAWQFASTVHGAGRVFGRKEAKRRFTRVEMDAWLKMRGVTLIGGDLDESPMAYRRLPDVLSAHGETIDIEHTLRPFAVVMAGAGEFDPFKD